MADMENRLDKKYPDLPGSKPVERAVKAMRRDGDKIPDKKEDRISAYMKRLEYISRDERGFELLKNMILEEFTLDVEDEENLKSIARGLYESEKKIAIEQGRGAEVTNLEKEQDINKLVEHYMPLIQEKAEIQKRTLATWLDYLQQNDAYYPMEFRYWVVRSLAKMGVHDPENVTYAKRSENTLARFPELNAEALGLVREKIKAGISLAEFNPENHAELEENVKLQQELIKNQDFARLYAIAQVESGGQLNRESLEGEWRKYDKGSDESVLEAGLKGKGTGWCTAVGSAKGQLEQGDFYVFYTKNYDGAYTEPRIAIRMTENGVTEVRGVNPQQELEPELVETAQAKCKELPGGDRYEKKAQDMKWLTGLVKKDKAGEQFTKEDLQFLYEINGSIEGFGYTRDPRIDEIQAKRNQKEDVMIMLDYKDEEVSSQANEISEKTKIYVGKWDVEILKKVKNYPNIEQLYRKFPKDEIFIKTIETDSSMQSQKTALPVLYDKNIIVSESAWGLLWQTEYSKENTKYRLASFKVSELGLSSGTLDEIYEKAKSMGLELCPAEVGPNLVLSYSGKNRLHIGMKREFGGQYPGSIIFSLFPDDKNPDGAPTLGSRSTEYKERIYGIEEFVFCY